MMGFFALSDAQSRWCGDILEAGRITIGNFRPQLRVRLAVEAGSDRPSDVEALVERFIDLVFAPHQLRALLGERPEALLEQSPSRIEHAIAVLKASGLLPRAA